MLSHAQCPLVAFQPMVPLTGTRDSGRGVKELDGYVCTDNKGFGED